MVQTRPPPPVHPGYPGASFGRPYDGIFTLNVAYPAVRLTAEIFLFMYAPANSGA